MKKVLTILFNVLLIAGLVFFLSFSGSREKELLCTEIRINMKDTLNAGFLKQKDIENTLVIEEAEILGYPIGDINIRSLEKILLDNAYISNAEIYSNLNGVLNVDVVQRRPVIRIITPAQRSYYLDREGHIFPEKAGFTPHVLIANGYFTEDNHLKKVKAIHELEENDDYREWKDALELAIFIEESEFWESQIVQVYYNSKGDFELVPRVGAHQIIFGDASEMKQKFKKLKTLYEEGLKYEGWNKYEKINLKYNNQVICTKR